MTSTEDTLLNQEIRDSAGGLRRRTHDPSARGARRRHLEAEVGRQAPVRRGRRVAVAGVAFGWQSSWRPLRRRPTAPGHRPPTPPSPSASSAASLDSLGTTVTTASTSADPGPQAVDALEGCTTVWRPG